MVRTFTGKNSFALQAALSEVVSKAADESGELGIERLDAAEVDVDILVQAVSSLPFLSSKKTVIIRNIESSKPLAERLEELIERTAENVDVVLVEPALDRRKSTFKLLKKLTEFHEFAESKEQDLPVWAIKYAASLGARLGRVEAVLLIDRVGTNQQLLARELEKLALYNPLVDKRTINLLTDQSVQSTVFSLLDAAFSGDSKRALELYREQRRARIEPQYVIAMLTWQLQTLAYAVHAVPREEATLIAAGQSPFTARKALALSKKISKADLRRMIVDLSELDALIKTSADPDAGIETYLLSL